MVAADVKRLRKMGNESYRITVEEINLQQMAAKFVRALKIMRDMKDQRFKPF